MNPSKVIEYSNPIKIINHSRSFFIGFDNTGFEWNPWQCTRTPNQGEVPRKMQKE